MASSNPRPGSATDPQALMQMHFSFAASRVLAAGVQLGVFTHIAAGHKTAEAVARQAGASERGVRMLLDALAGFELLTKRDGDYELAPLAAGYLVQDAPDYMGALFETDTMWEDWSRLVEAIRTGQPVMRAHEQAQAETFFPRLVRTLHVANREPARRAAEVLGAGTEHHGLAVLDVACGSGVWGIAVAEADKKARVTAQDFPGVLAVTKEFLRRHDVDNRYDFLTGDLKQVDFGENRYDLALLGHILHGEGERSSRDLLHRLRRALRSGGRVAIADMVPNEQRTGPPFPLAFALQMLLHSAEGDTYTLADYTRWLNEAGFPRVETADIGSHSPMVIGE